MCFALIYSYHARILFLILSYFSPANSTHIPLQHLWHMWQNSALYVMIKNAELTKLWMLAKLIHFYHVGSLKLLERWNSLSANVVNIDVINYFDDYVWSHTYIFKNFINSYHKFLGGPWPTWPTLLSRHLVSIGIANALGFIFIFYLTQELSLLFAPWSLLIHIPTRIIQKSWF